jgi:dipeptide/tripeptide permease
MNPKPLGCQMDSTLFGNLNLSPPQLRIFYSLTLVLLIPLMERIVYPLTKKAALPLSSTMGKMGIGLFTTNLAFLASAIIEIYRKRAAVTNKVAFIILIYILIYNKVSKC